jgi:GAF domain-containing protein
MSSLDETERQRALDLYHVVDSFPEAAYDDIACLAAQLCGVPIALVSLIDRDRQWFKGATGLQATGTARDIAFCDHAIRTPGQLMEVPDATMDTRFARNPLVTGLGGRFYAGMPLVTPGGAAIGTVCVMDCQPRELDDVQRQGMAALARLTMNLLEARNRQRELERAALFATQEAPATAEALEETLDLGPCTIAIFEVQDVTAVIQRIGERALRRTLDQLEQLLHTGLRPQRHDSVSHVTDSADMIVVLHGDDVDAVLQPMVDLVAGFERQHGLRVLVGSARSEDPGERLESVYLRADRSLSEAKDMALMLHAKAA